MPGMVPQGLESDALVELIDLFPTIMEITCVDVPDSVHIQGKSLLPLIQRKKIHHRDAVFSEYFSSTMMYDGRYLFIDHGKECSPELYDKKNDPKEFTNIVDNLAQKSRVKEMMETVIKFKESDVWENTP
jgi:arylsulfatase